MFRIKICGIRSVDDALSAAAAGADAIGLNFFERSPRYCDRETAKKIVSRVPSSICKVGVFLNATVEIVRGAVATLGLDLVQLHGDESPEYLESLRGVPVMKAFRVQQDLGEVETFLQSCHRRRSLPRMALLDASQPGQFGGTGKTLDWQSLNAQRHRLLGMPLVLAGGLTPRNVAQAIHDARPWGVDTASGVEAAPGKKSPEAMREFVEAARLAFLGISARRA